MGRAGLLRTLGAGSALLAVSCGSATGVLGATETNATGTTLTPGVDTVYCERFANREPRAPEAGDPKDVRRWWDEVRAYRFRVLFVAPKRIDAATASIEQWTRNVATPALERSGYQLAAMPVAPADVVAAARAIAAYDRAECTVLQPT